MTDDIDILLLKVLGKVCCDGRYRVLSNEELIAAFPGQLAPDGERVEKSIRRLAECGYISLRFDGGGEYCLSVTPAGKAAGEFRLPGKKSKFFSNGYVKLFLTVFFAVFFALLFYKAVAIW